MNKEEIRPIIEKKGTEVAPGITKIPCSVCGEMIYSCDDMEGVEYMQTARGTEQIFHTDCYFGTHKKATKTHTLTIRDKAGAKVTVLVEDLAIMLGISFESMSVETVEADKPERVSHTFFTRY